MSNPWLTGTEYFGIKQQNCCVDDRKAAAARMTAAQLEAAIAWPDTQKTVRQFCERRLRNMKRAAKLGGRRYLDRDGAVVAVTMGLGGVYIVARGCHRVKSRLLPPRETAAECQRDLDLYAKDMGWKAVSE